MKKQAIIIPCYNRIEPLKRLLASLSIAIYQEPIDLIFSIDYSGSDNVTNLCQEYNWKYGEKRIICHKRNIGLRSNIIFCGDLLIEDYERIILLEDDLLVNQFFCKYALAAADFYEKEDDIAGISLFAYAKSEVGLFDFYPLKDKFDTFFMQWPSSWGQLWTRKQWMDFKLWLDYNYDFQIAKIPDYVKSWKNSWKKFFVAYLVEKRKYFVYPYNSFSVESACPGTHFSTNITYSIFNTSLSQTTNIKFRVYLPNNDDYKYDCFFQPIDKTIIIGSKEYFVAFDLYATKKLRDIESDFIVTSRTCHDYIATFGSILIPFELNIPNEIEGTMFYLAKRRDFKEIPINSYKRSALRITLSTKDMIKVLVKRLFTIFSRLYK